MLSQPHPPSPLYCFISSNFLVSSWRQHLNLVVKVVGALASRLSHLEAKEEFHREKHLVPFLWAGSNMRRQNATRWVNLQLLPPQEVARTTSQQPCSVQPALLDRTSRQRGLLMRRISAQDDLKPFTLSSKQIIVSHTLCIMFEPINQTNACCNIITVHIHNTV